MSKRVKREGQQFGLVKVLRYDGAGMYECECQGCGKIYLVNTRNIGKNGACKECYLKSIMMDLTDRRFGRLTAKTRTSKKRGKYQRSAWVCECDCGRQTIVNTDCLTFGLTRSCGCTRGDMGMPEKIKNDFAAGTQLSKINSVPTKANKTGVVGVNWDKARNKWQASIRIRGKKIALGRYEQFEDAVTARKEGEKKYFQNILDMS